ncbi:uncharacterized protein TRIADDRAFT_7695, partial [Trichoplax adhaerens]
IPDDLDEIRCLFREYRKFVDVDTCCKGFQQVLRNLPGKYAPPQGRLLLALDQGNVAGCVGLREVEPGICEMKHLYVRPKFQGKKFGRALAETVIQEARNIGYTRMRLDTLKELKAALSLYKSLDFKQVHP